MSRSSPWLLILSAATAIAINCWGSTEVSEASEPNIVVIDADSMRFTDAHSSSGVCKTRSESVPRWAACSVAGRSTPGPQQAHDVTVRTYPKQP